MAIFNSSPRWRRTLGIAGLVLAVFTVTGFFIAPRLAKSQLEKRLSAQLGRTVTVEKIRLNPYTLAITLENFDVRTKEGDGSFLGWRRLYVNFDALASLRGPWVLGVVELEGFHAAPLIHPDGSYNFSDILARLQATSAAAGPMTKPGRPWRIGRLAVSGARVEFIDQSRPQPFATSIGPIAFTLTGFQTTSAPRALYFFQAVTEENEKLNWHGTLQVEPLSSRGELQVENIVLRKYAPYYAHYFNADLTGGSLSVRGQYELSFAKDAQIMKLNAGTLEVRGLKVVERDAPEAAVDLPSLIVTGIKADALKRSASIQAVRVAGGHLRVRREKDGALNLRTMFAPPASASAQATASVPASAPPSTPVPLPELTVGEVALADFQVELADLSPPNPAHLALTGLQFSLKNLSLAEGAVMPLQLAFNWAPQGAVTGDGSVTIKPGLKADLTLDVAGLAILPLSPYLEQFVAVRITQGAVSTRGAVTFAQTEGAPAITFAGGVTVEQLGLVDGAHNEELAGVGSLALHDLKLSTAPQLTLSLAELNVNAPYARVLINADKTVNLALVAKPAAMAEPVGEALPPDSSPASGLKTPPASEPAGVRAPLPKIEIAKVVIAGGDFTLTDRSIEPHVRVAVTQFGGTIAGLSSANFAKGEVDLKAAVDGAGPITITGQLDPLSEQRFADLKIDLKNVDLLPLSPYSGKFAGYEIARGKLALDVQARLDGKKLDATNVITLNQFNFGAPVASAEATGLPVRLGVALLKDPSGRIVIDVPVSGDLDDPNFRIGKIVLRVVVNLLTKAAVSPFSLLGSMFGGGGDELAFQEFAPGGSALLPGEQSKRDTMVKALQNRPALSLALEGSYDAAADTHALKQQKVTEWVRGKIWEQRRALDPNIPPPAELTITLEDQAAMVKQLFSELFPAGMPWVAPVATTPAPASAPPPLAKTFLGRVRDLVTLKGLRKGGLMPAAAKASPVAAAAGMDPAGASLAEMTDRLAETMTVTDNDLRALAADRAQRVRDYFLKEGKIEPERLFLAQGKEAKVNHGPRVFLSLQ